MSSTSSTCSTYKKHYKCVKPPNKIKLLIVGEAPPKEDENYFYCLARIDTDGRKRQFFRGIMKGVGLLKEDTKWDKKENMSKEKRLLEEFLKNGYFLIDTCPEPLKGESSKVKEMKEWVPSLEKRIEILNPEKVLFVTRTNQTIRKSVVENEKFQNGMIYEEVLYYPGNGWLCKFIEEFPPEYRLSPIF